MRRRSFALPLLFVVAGCSGGEGLKHSGYGVASPEAAAKAETREADSATVIGLSTSSGAELPRKIIFTGRVQMACENLERATDNLSALVKKHAGYIGDASSDGTRGTTRAGSWMVRIPSEEFDAFMVELPALGELESTQRQAQDVSAEFYDAEARVRNKRVEEQRLVEIVRRPNTNLDSLLRVEKELSRVREEIETTEGRLRLLAHQSDLSTVTIAIREAKVFKPEGPPTVSTRVSRTFGGSVDSLKEFGVSILLVVVSLAPWMIPMALVGAILYAIVRIRIAALNRDRRPTPLRADR